MARKAHYRGYYPTRVRRDVFTSSLTPSFDSFMRRSMFSPALPTPIINTPRDPVYDTFIEDHREFRPDVVERAFSVRGSPAKSTVRFAAPTRVRARAAAIKAFSPSIPAGHRVFSAPKYVDVCIRRKRRKEVLHALNKVGRGTRPPKRNALSDIRC